MKDDIENIILAIRMRQLGDVIATLGALKAVKAANPAGRLLFLVDTCYHPLLKNESYIDELIPPPPKIGRFGEVLAYVAYVEGLRRRNIDIVLDFHSNPRSAILSYFTGAKQRVGFDVRVRKVCYTMIEPRAVWEDGKMRTRSTLQAAVDLVRNAVPNTGANASPPELALDGASIRKGLDTLERVGVAAGAVGINPGNPYPAKEWPDAFFAKTARRLAEAGRQVVVMWGPGEQERAERIQREAGNGTVLSPYLVLSELPGVLKHLSLLITIDSGLKHLAVTVRTPTLTIFGPTNPGEWHIGTERDEYLYLGLTCSPCRLLRCPFGTPCMARVSPEHVLARAEKMLAIG